MAGVDFEALLKDAMGLDAASLGPTTIARAVQARMATCGIPGAHAYWLRIRASPSELQELIEAVVVPETWFFRDREAFVALADMARAELIEHPARSELRLLSLPCSSGEEPFSMAIALLEAGIPDSRFRVAGIDISQRALELAGQACYGLNSFRGQELGFRARHFQAADGKWQLAERVRKRVCFQQGNLFAADFLPGRDLYDYIFCRNVLIYFDQRTQARALEVLLRLLTPQGCLFVGPSETALLPRQRLASAQRPMAFAFRHAVEAVPVASATTRPKPAIAAAGNSDVAASRKQVNHSTSRSPPGNSPATNYSSVTMVQGKLANPRADGEAALAKMQELANQGRLIEATAAGKQYLREYGTSARAFCLLGVIRDAAGDPTAAAALYRKALYLDPGHQESLTHLAFLLDKQGNGNAARVLRERLQRLNSGASG